MREIKFRAWDKEHNVMRNFERIAGWSMSELNDKDTSQLYMQYTGLKDIYEGDIIEDEEGDNYLIFWCESSFAFKADLIGIDDDGKRTYGKFDEFYLFDISSPMVIGNIYENPELLN